MTSNIYTEMFDDIRNGAKTPASKILVTIRRYELSNDYSPMPDADLLSSLEEVGITREDCSREKILVFLYFADSVTGWINEETCGGFHFTSLDQDGAVQDHLDKAMVEGGLIYPEVLKPFGYEYDRKMEHLKNIGTRP